MGRFQHCVVPIHLPARIHVRLRPGDAYLCMKARAVLLWRSSSLSIHCMEQHHTASNWLHSHWFGRGVVRCVCLDGASVSRPVCIGFDSVGHLFLHRMVGWMGRNAFPRGTFRFVPIKDVGLCLYVSWVVVCVFHLGRTTTSFLPCTMVHPSIHASFLRIKVVHVVPTLHLGLGGWEPTHPSVPPHTHTPHPLPWIPPPCGISFHPEPCSQARFRGSRGRRGRVWCFHRLNRGGGRSPAWIRIFG